MVGYGFICRHFPPGQSASVSQLFFVFSTYGHIEDSVVVVAIVVVAILVVLHLQWFSYPPPYDTHSPPLQSASLEQGLYFWHLVV